MPRGPLFYKGSKPDPAYQTLTRHGILVRPHKDMTPPSVYPQSIVPAFVELNLLQPFCLEAQHWYRPSNGFFPWDVEDWLQAHL